MSRPDPCFSADRVQASKEDKIEDVALVLIEVGMDNGLSYGRTAENVLFGEINLLSADRLLGEGRKEGIQASNETDARCGGNNVNHV